MIYLWLSNNSIGNKDEYNLVVSWENDDLTFEKILDEIMSVSSSLKLIRLNKGQMNNSAVFLIVPDSNLGIDDISHKIKTIDPSFELSFYESKTNW